MSSSLSKVVPLEAQQSAKLTPAVQEDISHSVLCWLATVDEDGTPNVSPKELWCLHGDEALVIANIASPVSARNLASHPRACVSFVDVFRQRGWKLTGTAKLVTRDAPEFVEVASDLLRMAGPDFAIKNVIHLRIEAVARILAPSYRVFPDRTVEEQVRRAHETYGVRPAR